MTFGSWCAYIVLAILGTILFTGMEVGLRDETSPKTPKKFSWGFLAKDNVKRYLFTLLLIFIQLRFFKELNGVDLTPYTAILIGFGADGIAGFSKKKFTVLQADRDKLLKP